ncbi:MAG TPA: maleylpyruvate isomerase N-terminal domain-containing protein, partial [Mycobacterium sp.]
MNQLEATAGALAVLEDVVARIGADDVGRQTPCSEYDVASLTVHLRRSIDLLGAAAGAQLSDADPAAPVWEQLIPAARAALQAWQRRGVEGDIELGPQSFPARFAVAIL